MSSTLVKVQGLAARGSIRISDHGYDELDKDDILPSEILSGIHAAVAVEDYAEDERGERVLVLQQDARGKPIHVVWAIPRTQQAVTGHGVPPKRNSMERRFQETAG